MKLLRVEKASAQMLETAEPSRRLNKLSIAAAMAAAILLARVWLVILFE